MAGCLSPCPTDIVIDAGTADVLDRTVDGSAGSYTNPWLTGHINTGTSRHTFSWTIPSGITIFSHSFTLDYTVLQGKPQCKYGTGGFGTFQCFTDSLPGHYTLTGLSVTITGTIAPGNTITASIQGFTTNDYNDAGGGYPSTHSDAFFFEFVVNCFSLIITPVCTKPTVNIGTGDTAYLCTTVETRYGIYPQWVIDANKAWVILQGGVVVNSSLTPLAYPRLTHFTSPCNYSVIVTDCYPYALDSTHHVGDFVSGPYNAEFLTFVGDRGAGPEYDVATCSPFNIVIDHLCPILIGPPPPPPPGGALGAIEVDSPRQWIHVGASDSYIRTYNNDYTLQFAGKFPVGAWKGLRADPRRGTLVGLALTPGTDGMGHPTGVYSIWVSLDGGQTGNKVTEMAAGSSVLERDSERDWLLWFTSDNTTTAVSVAISTDGGETFAAAVAVLLDTGAPMRMTLYDTCHDCRAGGRIALVTSAGIMVSDDGGLTFRQVV